MEKLKMQSTNLVEDNIEKIAALFPSCITEIRDNHSVVCRSVDFDLLRQELSASLVEGPQERYTLTWPGKNEAILTANAPIAKTLRPCREESVDFANTKNIFIEGDNLDALKLLQETYLNKVKLIYIDPPYNTGKDFIYEDDFSEEVDSFLQRSNQKNEEGNRLVANTESNGRFHSDWLTMIYSRLRLARNLLREDGVIFMSIDDNEVHNLRKMCDEVFGEDNQIGVISNVNNPKGRSDDRFIATAHEYLLVYAKNKNVTFWRGFEPEEKVVVRYNKEDIDGKYREIDLRKTGDNDRREDRPNLFYYFYYNQDTGEFYPSKDDVTPHGFIKITPSREDGVEGNWRWEINTSINKIKLLFPKFMPVRKKWGVFEKDYFDKNDLLKPVSAWTFKDVNSERGSEQLIALGFSKEIFPKPKPVGLVKRTLLLSTHNNDVVLDFFSGSATTAHAVMQLNAEDNGNRTFIMVQLPEPCDEKSEAFKAGYKTIAEIGKERIRRAGKKIKEEYDEKAKDLDIGFRVFKVDTSNMQDVYYTPDQLKQEKLELLKDHIKPDRRPEDLLFQVFIDWGLELTLSIAKETIDGKNIFIVDTDALVACFDTGITEELVKKLAKYRPLRGVFRDDAFESDSVKINVEQIFKLLSPGTEVKAI